MSCVYKSFCMGHEPEFDTFAFEEQYDESLRASILASLSSFPSPFHEALPNVSSSSSLELKSLLNTLKYAFLGPNMTLPSCDNFQLFKSRSRNPSPRLVKGKSRGYKVDLRRHQRD